MEEYNYVEHMTIKEFPEEERPIEKLIKIGEKKIYQMLNYLLYNIRSGSKNITSISLAYKR